MRGTTLKAVIQKHGYRQVEVARRLNESQQNFSSLLNAEDLRSSLIERVSEALDIPVSEIYGESAQLTASANNGGTAIAGSGNTVNPQLEKCLDLLREKDVQIREKDVQISKLLDIIKATTK